LAIAQRSSVGGGVSFRTAVNPSLEAAGETSCFARSGPRPHHPQSCARGAVPFMNIDVAAGRARLCLRACDKLHQNIA